MFLSLVSLILRSTGYNLQEEIITYLCCLWTNHNRCTCTWYWTERFLPLRTGTVWIPLPTSAERCQLEDGHNLSFLLEYRLSVVNSFPLKPRKCIPETHDLMISYSENWVLCHKICISSWPSTKYLYLRITFFPYNTCECVFSVSREE